MIFQAHMVAAKLAGALNGLAYREESDGGFVVASLKRALQYFDPAMKGADTVEKKQIVDPQSLQLFRHELFAIRDEILVLMKKYRG